MKVDLTHLARPIQHREPKIKLLDPLYRGITRYMQKVGLMQNLTYSYLGGVNGNTTNYGPLYSPVGVSVAEITLDFAAIAADRTAKGQAALGAADILNIIGIRAGTYVLAVAAQVTTEEGATATADIGDADEDEFIAALDLNSAGWYSSLVTTDASVAVGGGKIYAVDDTLDFQLNHASVDVAVCRVVMVSFDLRASR